MADGDDDDRDRPGTSESDASALESWGDLDGGIGRGRATRSWSQLAALDEEFNPGDLGFDDEAFVSLTAALDTLEAGAGSVATVETPPTIPAGTEPSTLPSGEVKIVQVMLDEEGERNLRLWSARLADAYETTSLAETLLRALQAEHDRLPEDARS